MVQTHLVYKYVEGTILTQVAGLDIGDDRADLLNSITII